MSLKSLPAPRRLLELVRKRWGSSICLAALSEDQLLQLAKWLGDGQAKQTIASTVHELWGSLPNTKTEVLVKALEQFEAELFKEGGIGHDLQLFLDPLTENALLIKDFWHEWKIWSDKAKVEGATGIVLEKADRLGRLLTDAIKNHVEMQVRLSKEKLLPTDGARKGAQLNVGTMNVLVQTLDEGTDDMDGFLGKIGAELTKYAKPMKRLDTSKAIEVETAPERRQTDTAQSGPETDLGSGENGGPGQIEAQDS